VKFLAWLLDPRPERIAPPSSRLTDPPSSVPQKSREIPLPPVAPDSALPQVVAALRAEAREHSGRARSELKAGSVLVAASLAAVADAFGKLADRLERQ
jgi:hypothetical protein